MALFGCKKDKVQSSVQEDSGVAQKAPPNSNARLGAFVSSGYSLVWEDEFDGTSLNTNNWFVGCKEPVSGDRYLCQAGVQGTACYYKKVFEEIDEIVHLFTAKGSQ